MLNMRVMATTTTLFTWTHTDGRHGEGDELPDEEDSATIVELVFNRNKERFQTDGVRPHESHSRHEAAMYGGLPANLSILRADNCKLRTFPVLPKSIVEIYMSHNNLMVLPDLSMFQNLIVLELEDNSIPEVVNPLPPNLARLNVSVNAIRQVNMTLFEGRGDLNVDFQSNPYIPQQYRFAAGTPRAPAQAAMFIAGVHGDGPVRPNANTVYNSSQSVHATGVQTSIAKNIAWLVNYRTDVPVNIQAACKSMDCEYSKHHMPIMHRLLFATGIAHAITNIRGSSPGAIVASFSRSPYVMHGVTLEKLADRVWLRIMDTADKERRKELQKRFFEEVQDGHGHCQNGMMSRLANVFVGFDENVTMQLRGLEVIGARISASMTAVRKRLNLKDDEDTAEYNREMYKEVLEHLQGLRDIPAERWQEWLEMFSTEVMDAYLAGIDKGVINDGNAEDHAKSAGVHGFPWEMRYLITTNK
jgi:hypothetical protein